ncbi:hypothetical protein CLV43_106283 [Umezawaea tangerina]|uniref:Uncharacterized protein n=1 Tax=Umezawaea tangerina TaxID=84725 RepID=A0A2T0T4E5_9PSEU|nr:hypothetical protein CLV43_106283 [Umezawaea tangerina]
MPRLNRNRTVGRRWCEGEWVAVGGLGGLLLHSAATDYYPAVRLGLWDDAPPTIPGGRDHVLEVTCPSEVAGS